MSSVNDCVIEYVAQLRKGSIQKAYKEIMMFMSDLRTHLESSYSDHYVSAVYFGYMDMTYFAFTPAVLKNMKLKIAVVFLHAECRFEVWLAGNNRQVQAEYIEFLENKDMGRYTLSEAAPGVDSIITSVIEEKPDFNNHDGLIKHIEEKTNEFIDDIKTILKA